MFTFRQLFAGCLLLISSTIFAWNDVGHKLVAQIAWDHMTAESRILSEEYNGSLNVAYPALNFIQAATWLDTIRYRDVKWYNHMHYVDWPFSQDDTELPAIAPTNALTAVNHALLTMRGKYARNFDKGLALRVLIHVVADIHQPLHATTRVNAEHPHGDAGGNGFPIKGSIAKNLHSYWDKGGGSLISKDKSALYIQERAKSLAETWPCDTAQAMDLNPQHWLEESHAIGVNKAYALKEGIKPDKLYEEETRALSEQRIALAGCRLAALLNSQHLIKKQDLA